MDEKKLDNYLETVYARADWDMIPDYMIDGVKNWIENGWEPGSFLKAILERRIWDAVWNADHYNEQNIAKWVKFCEWYLPPNCQGSEENVRDWKAMGGYRRAKASSYIDS